MDRPVMPGTAAEQQRNVTFYCATRYAALLSVSWYPALQYGKILTTHTIKAVRYSVILN
jgi:hypothetical protein